MILIEEMKLSVQALFGLNPKRPLSIPISLDEIERSLSPDRAVFSEEMTGFDREDALRIHSRRQGAVEIDGAPGLSLEPSVEPGKVTGEETIGFFLGLDFLKTHFFDKTVLQNAKEPFDSSLRLGRESGNHPDLELPEGSLKLALRPSPPQKLFFQAGFPGRTVSGMPIDINRLRKAVAAGVVKEALHGREGTFVVIEAGKDISRGVINVTHQDKLRPPGFEPVVVGAIDLSHLPEARFPLPPLAVPPGFLAKLPESFFEEPLSQGLPSDSDLVFFPKLLLGEDGTKAPVTDLAKSEDAGLKRFWMPAVGGLALKPVKDPLFSFEPNPPRHSLDLTEGKAEKPGRFFLFEPSLEGLLDDSEFFPCLQSH